MTGRERIMTALARKQPDMVPIWELAFNEESIINIAAHFMDEDKLPPKKFFFDMTDNELFQLIAAFKAMSDGLDLDGGNTTSNVPIERVDDQHVRDDHGTIFLCSEHGEPYPVQGPIGNMDDLKKYKMRKPIDEDYLILNLARAQAPDKAISFMMPGTFFMSWSLRGSMEKLLMDFALDPQLSHGLARMTTDYCLESIDMIAKKGADFVAVECDLAFKNGLLMSEDMYDEFIGQYYAEIVAHGHDKGLKFVKHSDGVLNKLIPHFIDNGFDAIHPIQPQCMDIGEIKKEFSDRLCIMGNIDCAFLLVFGTPEEVRQSVKETITAAAPGGGYIITSSNTIHPGVKPENYIAMVKAAREYGKYPELAGA